MIRTALLPLPLRRRALSLLLAGLVALAGVVALTAPPAAAAAEATAGQGASYRIALIVFRGCEDACRGFQDFLTSRKVPAAVKVYDAATNSAAIPGFVEEIKRERPDLVVTWGTTTALTTFGPYDAVDPAKHITDIPGVFMIVSQPIEAKLVPDFSSSGRNITGTNYLVPESVQLEAARSYLSFDRIGVIYTPTESNSVINTKRVEEEGVKLGVEVLARPVALGPDGKPDPTSIAPLVADLAAAGIDLLYQGADTFLNINRQTLTAEAVTHGIPVFAAGEAPVRDGKALMGVVNQYYVVGQLTALKAEQVLKGTAPADIPIEAPRRFSFLINLPVAKTLGIYPPMKLIRFAEFIR
ncbi:ABC transporter substrate-binding protein [Caenispirillum bisanense]|uniref:Putative ABC transport system substrate-binding protein n=1 Tax=Caenispirillum bisanense TaxID=414052 RepID=A0A286GB01_9PROT|nr:ABC transporter substrate-binding protein [Caenispirillum bisanense]SOD92703.1 putative ABC transport system substrate-binding protein [Caenispirillum bisanense]